MTNENIDQGIPIILRGLAVLEKVIDTRRPISTSELITKLGIPKPTLNRILIQLEKEGFLQREPIKRHFLPGHRARKLLFQLMSNENLSAPRHSILQELSDKVEETCNCTMLDGNHTVYFDRVESNWPYRIQLPIGSQLPLHCTASGKLFLAFMQARQRRRLITATPLKNFTESTITDVKLLGEELKQIKAEGYGVDNEEFMEGMVAISMPILNPSNEICFTVAIHAPTIRKSLNELKDYLPALRDAATAMAHSYCSN